MKRGKGFRKTYTIPAPVIMVALCDEYCADELSTGIIYDGSTIDGYTQCTPPTFSAMKLKFQ